MIFSSNFERVSTQRKRICRTERNYQTNQVPERSYKKCKKPSPITESYQIRRKGVLQLRKQSRLQKNRPLRGCSTRFSGRKFLQKRIFHLHRSQCPRKPRIKQKIVVLHWPQLSRLQTSRSNSPLQRLGAKTTRVLRSRTTRSDQLICGS